MPNRRFPNPPPFAYHPELFPDLSQTNPEPSSLSAFPTPKPQKKHTLRASVVEQPTHFKLDKSVTPQVFGAHQQLYDWKHETKTAKYQDFQVTMHKKMAQHFMPNYDKAHESMRR